MRDYGKVSPQFWIGKTGKEIKACGVEAQLVALYVMTCPHANMLGLFYLPVMYIAHETGLGLEGASKGLHRLCETGFCRYDTDSEVIWVVEMAGHQIGKALSSKDLRCKGAQNSYSMLPDNPFLSEFYDKYSADFHLTGKRQSEVVEVRSLQAPSKPLASQEQYQEQEQEQKQEHKQILPGAQKQLPAAELENPNDPVFFRLPLNDNSLYPITESYVALVEDLYSAVDVRQEFKKMYGWLISNPRRKKTKRGIESFITSWLCRAQDKANSQGEPPKAIDHLESFRRLICSGGKPRNEAEKIALSQASKASLGRSREHEAQRIWKGYLLDAYAVTGEVPNEFLLHETAQEGTT